MSDNIVNSENQRYIKLTALFSSGGWALYEQELKEMHELALLKIQEVTRQPVTDLSQLNLAICQRNALDMLFCKIAELQEEILGDSAISPDEA